MELMLVLAHSGDHAQAAKIASDLERQINRPDGEFLTDLGRTYAQCAAAPNADAKLRSRYTSEAIRVLQLAIANGYRDEVYLKTEPDLDPLRSLPEFPGLLKSARAEAKK